MPSLPNYVPFRERLAARQQVEEGRDLRVRPQRPREQRPVEEYEGEAEAIAESLRLAEMQAEHPGVSQERLRLAMAINGDLLERFSDREEEDEPALEQEEDRPEEAAAFSDISDFDDMEMDVEEARARARDILARAPKAEAERAELSAEEMRRARIMRLGGK